MRFKLTALLVSAARQASTRHIRTLSSSSSGHSGSIQRPSFNFLPPQTAADSAASQPEDGSNCCDRLLASLRASYAEKLPNSQTYKHLASALSAAADCRLDSRDAHRLRAFFTEEATHWGLDQKEAWLIGALRLLTEHASPPGQLFFSLVSYALDAEPMRSSPTVLLAVANASSIAGSRPDLTHRALARLLVCGASPNQLRAMSAIACRLLAKQPDQRLFEQWRRCALGASAKSAEAPSQPDSAGDAGPATPQVLLKNPALIARYGTDKELFELYASAENAWNTGSLAGIYRQPIPIVTESFVDALVAAGRLRTISDLFKHLLLPMRDRRGLPIFQLSAVMPRLLDLLNQSRSGQRPGRWTSRTVDLTGVLPASKATAALDGHLMRRCPACGGQLAGNAYRPEPSEAEVGRLLAAVSGVLEFQGSHRHTSPGLMAAYHHWLAEARASRGPFDLVVDGSNLVLHRGFVMNHSKLKFNMKIAMQHLVASVDWVLKQKPQPAKPLHIGVLYKFSINHLSDLRNFQSALSQLRREHPGVGEATLFKSGSADDLLALHAALSSGPDCYMLSKDVFRDHSAVLGGSDGSETGYLRQAFVDWQMARQIFYRILSSGGDVLTPLGSPQCSDVPVTSSSRSSRSLKSFTGPMHLLAVLPEAAQTNDANEGLIPNLCWQCVRFESQ